MAVKENTTLTTNIDVTAREIDFVTRFDSNWEALRNLMGIMRPIRKQPGTVLRAYTTTVTLADGNVPEGDEIPYSLAEITETLKSDVDIKKYAKGITIEDVNKYGADIAVNKSDEEFLNELQGVVLKEFYDFIKTGTLSVVETSWQRALAMARGNVLNKFAKMHKTVTEVVGFANILDLYDYLGDKDVTVQTAFGLTYVQNFLGYRTLFLLSDTEIPEKTVIATPVENVDLYYVDPADSDFAKLGLVYRTAGETNLIGFHAQGRYSHAVGESYALMGMKLWAEYLDGIAVATVGEKPTPTESITLDKNTLALEVEATGTLEATTIPAGATVTWTSSDETVATVANGVVTGVADGEATITAKNGSATATCTVIVGTGA